MNQNLKNYLTINYIFSIIFGILFCITIIGIIFGVPLIIGANKFKKAINHSTLELQAESNTLFIWSVVIGVLTLPVGILVIICGIMINDEINKLNPDEIIVEDKKSFSDSFKETFGIKDDLQKKKEKLETLKKNERRGAYYRRRI